MVLVAGTAAHVTIPHRGRVSVKEGPLVDGHQPSATLLLESAARAYGRRCVGLILTGMGHDGADGMVAIKNAGGKTIAQSQDSCVVFGMPGAAIAKGAAEFIIHGDDLSEAVVTFAKGGTLSKD